ncbi:5-oxoprolinase subunit PxpB [Salibacterium sp. K-3]
MEPLQMNMVSDTAIRVTFGTVISVKTHQHIRAFCRELEDHPREGIQEWVPAYTTVTVFYDPLRLSPSDLQSFISGCCETMKPQDLPSSPQISIPVCYDETFGPDLKRVAEQNQLTTDEVIARHTEAEYLVYMMGFIPGFPYLGGMNENIAAPRLETPRAKVPAGSVGIANTQTGVYPLESPGGWNIIGKTPKKLFRPDKTEPVLLDAGMIIRFRPVSKEEFRDIEQKEAEK